MTADSRNWFVLALILGLGWLVYRLSPIITPFVISAALAYLGDPLVDRLESLRIFRWTVGRTLAVVLVFLLMVAETWLVLAGPDSVGAIRPASFRVLSTSSSTRLP